MGSSSKIVEHFDWFANLSLQLEHSFVYVVVDVAIFLSVPVPDTLPILLSAFLVASTYVFGAVIGLSFTVLSTVQPFGGSLSDAVVGPATVSSEPTSDCTGCSRQYRYPSRLVLCYGQGPEPPTSRD